MHNKYLNTRKVKSWNYQLTAYSVILILFSIPFSLSAQIGIKAGIGASDLAFSKDSWSYYLGYESDLLKKSRSYTSFQMGVFVWFKLGDKFELQPELLFVSQGANFDTKFTYGYVERWIRTEYFQIPLLVRYQTMPHKNWHISFLGGPYGAIAVYGDRSFEYPYYDTSRILTSEPNPLSNVNRFDFGIVLGLEISMDTNSGQAFIEFRGSYGLVNAMSPYNSRPKYYDSSDLSVRNVNLVCTIGYRLRKKGTIDENG